MNYFGGCSLSADQHPLRCAVLHTVLPGRVHRVYYEQLEMDPEGVVRRLLERYPAFM